MFKLQKKKVLPMFGMNLRLFGILSVLFNRCIRDTPTTPKSQSPHLCILTSLNSAICPWENMEKTLEPDRLADFLDPRELALVDALGVGAGSGSGAGAGSGSGGGAAASSFFFFFFFSLSACQHISRTSKNGWRIGYKIFKLCLLWNYKTRVFQNKNLWSSIIL